MTYWTKIKLCVILKGMNLKIDFSNIDGVEAPEDKLTPKLYTLISKWENTAKGLNSMNRTQLLLCARELEDLLEDHSLEPPLNNFY